MLDYRHIQLHPDANDPSGLSQRLRDYDHSQTQRQLEIASEPDWQERPPGRPCTVLPQQQAQTLLDAFDHGWSERQVAARYGPVFGFCRTWLQDNRRNGRLRLMAAGEG